VYRYQFYYYEYNIRHSAIYVNKVLAREWS